MDYWNSDKLLCILKFDFTSNFVGHTQFKVADISATNTGHVNNIYLSFGIVFLWNDLQDIVAVHLLLVYHRVRGFNLPHS